MYRHRHGRQRQFQFAENYTFRIKKDGAQNYFTLGAELDAAKSMADRIAAFLKVPSNSVELLYAHPDFQNLKLSRIIKKGRASRRPAQKKHDATVGEFCKRYVEVTAHLSRYSVANNVNSLRRIAAHILGLSPLSQAATKQSRCTWQEKVNSVGLDKITTDVLESLRRSMLQAAGADHLKRAKAVTSCNTYIRCASSMFTPKLASLFGGFELPEINPLRSFKPLPEQAHHYVSKIDASSLLTKARAGLEKSHGDVYLVLVLALCRGMRRAEIDRLTWEQVDLENGHIWIRTTEYSRPKTRNSECRIDLSPEIVELMVRYKAKDLPGPFVLPGSLNLDVRIRCGPLFSKALKWLHKHGVHNVTALHTLRKEAGSLVFSKGGSIDQAAEFLRNDPRVAREHYIARKGRNELSLPELNDSRIAGAGEGPE